jgi:hypothetical protein
MWYIEIIERFANN